MDSKMAKLQLKFKGFQALNINQCVDVDVPQIFRIYISQLCTKLRNKFTFHYDRIEKNHGNGIFISAFRGHWAFHSKSKWTESKTNWFIFIRVTSLFRTRYFIECTGAAEPKNNNNTLYHLALRFTLNLEFLAEILKQKVNSWTHRLRAINKYFLNHNN